ncbi:MAG: HP0495 family protein [Candidatus Methylopumilus sp.]
MSDQNTSPETLIEFPCHFPIKVMGEVHDEFTSTVIKIIKQKNQKFDPSTIEMKGSSEGRYISLTCFVYVTSKPELDDIYRSLSSHPMIKVVL